MAQLKTRVEKIRSKNAGPFWVTVDVFCHRDGSFDEIAAFLTTARVAAAFAAPEDTLQRYELRDLDVLKFSLPRPQIQGTRTDRDMHGAGFGFLLEELELA